MQGRGWSWPEVGDNRILLDSQEDMQRSHLFTPYTQFILMRHNNTESVESRGYILMLYLLRERRDGCMRSLTMTAAPQLRATGSSSRHVQASDRGVQRARPRVQGLVVLRCGRIREPSRHGSVADPRLLRSAAWTPASSPRERRLRTALSSPPQIHAGETADRPRLGPWQFRTVRPETQHAISS